ncbi:MAG: WG repeat-containing protein [Chitinophagaceae bacterium]|nr:WG repeat-containing protein [Chitinophagaceae bacterium]
MMKRNTTKISYAGESNNEVISNQKNLRAATNTKIIRVKQLILCFLLLAGFTAEAQELTPYKDANGKYGYKDKSGNIIQPKYDYARSFSEGLGRVKQNGKWGYIDKTGKEIVIPKYENAFSFNEGLAGVKQNGKWGFIDKTGKEIATPKYEYAYSFDEGLAAVVQNGKWGFIDKTGKEIVALQYDNAGGFSEGLSNVSLNKKCGFIDRSGKVVIPLIYDVAGSFSEGLVAVQQNGKWGFIDKTGKVVIKLQYENANSFKNNKAKVTLNSRDFYIDKTGKEIPAFTTLSPNFYEQFKAILMAKEVPGTGKVLSKDNSGWTRYSSAYKLDGFTVEEVISESYGGVRAAAEANTKKIDPNVVVRKELSNYTLTDATWNEWMVREISFELEKLKNEGFSVTTDNNIFRIGEITVRNKGINRDVAKLFLNKDNSVTIIFPNKNVGANANTNPQANNTQTKTTLKYKSGTIYEGEVVNNVPNGKGKMTFTTGTVYEGDFVNGKYEGKGKYTFSNGDFYEGDFANGKRSGKGKLTYKSGKVLEGDWEDDKFVDDTNTKPVENNNTSAESWARQGKRQLQENKYDEAIASFTKSIAMEPGNALYYTLRGSVYIITDNPAYKNDFEKAISIDPKNVMTYFLRAGAFAYKGRNDEAAADYRKVLEIDPNHKAAKKELEKITGEEVK